MSPILTAKMTVMMEEDTLREKFDKTEQSLHHSVTLDTQLLCFMKRATIVNIILSI